MKKILSYLLIFILLFQMTACTKPQEKHIHAFVDGVCTDEGCNEIDPNYKPPHTHTFVDGVCTGEGCEEKEPDYKPPHTHTFVDGVCTGEGCEEKDPNYKPPHTHTFVNGVCTGEGCNEKDPNYQPPHTHTFVNGVCTGTGCGATDPNYKPPHTHTFVDGVCTGTDCNEKDPNWINWYTPGYVNITKNEVEQILAQQYKKPKNVIVMIGDGMGPNDLILAEKYSSGCYSFGLIMNMIPNTGYATTYSANAAITDSAASGTALATGVKTNNGMIGMSPSYTNLTNISEIARQYGKKIGIVTNDNIVGATPSAFSVHNTSRTNLDAIANSYISYAPDVLFGQGYYYFRYKNLSNFLVSYETEGLSEIDKLLNKDPQCTKPLIGFFTENTTVAPSNTLAHYTEVALNRLKNEENGFFLMVENTAADNAGHAMDMQGKLNAIPTMERAIAVVLKFMKDNPDTLLIITSDHETGGVQLPPEGVYPNNSLFTTNDHSAANVRTFAVGYGAEYFNNTTIDNTDIAKFAINAVKGIW